MTGRTLRSLALCCCLATLAAHAQYTKLSSSAAEVRDFVAASATVGYAGTYGGGLWKTTDAGANWTKTSLTPRTVWKIALNPSAPTTCVFAATETGLLRSSNGGTSWTQVSNDDTRAVAIAPGAGACGTETLLIGVYGAGVFKSTNGGTTMTRSSGTGANVLDSTGVLGLAYYPGQSAVAYAVLQCNVDNIFENPDGNWGGVYRTADGGANWTAMNGGLTHPDSNAPCVTSIAANGTSVVVGTTQQDTQGTVFRIGAVGTTTWTQCCANGGQPYGVYFIGPDFSNASGFFFGSHQFGPWRSTDGGATLNQVFTGTDPDMKTRSFAAGAFSGTTFVAGIYGLGLFRTATGGSPWALPTTPIAADRVNDVANHASAAPNTFWLALEGGGVMKSTNAGTSWAQLNNGFSFLYGGADTTNFVRTVRKVTAHPSNTAIVAAGLAEFGLYSLSGGTTWNQVGNGTGFTAPWNHQPQALLITPGGTVYYSLFDALNGGIPGGLYKAAGGNIAGLASTGRPVYEFAPGQPAAPGAYKVRYGTDAENNHFLLMLDSMPYQSVNGGPFNRVTIASAAPNDVGFQRIAFFDIANNPFNGALAVGSTNRGIYQSTSFGSTWSRLSSAGLADTALNALVYTSNGVLWGGDRAGVLSCSSDNGSTWQQATTFGTAINELKIMNGLLHILTDGNGMWRKNTVGCP